MKRQVRCNVFETNSSSEHSVSIRIGKFYSVDTWIDDDTDDIDIDADEVLDSFPIEVLEKEVQIKKEEIMKSLNDIPTEMLEYELKRRKNEKS